MASMSNPPAGCVPAAASPATITVVGGERQSIAININCQPSNVGYVKIKVLGKDGAVLTRNSTITLWTSDGELIPGTGIANSLALGSGAYTEEVTVLANKSFYAWVRGLPQGYLDYKSNDMTVAKNQHKSADINLNYTGELVASADFVFSGATAPRILSKNQTFTATVNQISYKNTKLTQESGVVTAQVGGRDCTVSYSGIWRLNCIAPNELGEYALLINAKYGRYTGTHSLPVEVREYKNGSGLLTITPAMSTSSDPPVPLYYEIMFNGTAITKLARQTVSVAYVDSPSAYPGSAGNLTIDDATGFWKLLADVPYKGEYMLDLFIEIEVDGVMYNTTYSSGFESTSNSKDLEAIVRLSKSILAPLESFRTDVELTFKGKVAYGLDIFELYLDGVFYTLNWNPSQRVYYLQFAAPSQEVCTSKLKFLIMDEEVSDADIHVLDVSKTKTGICPLMRDSSCSNIEDVRKCVLDYTSRVAFYSQEQIVGCINSGCSITPFAECPSDNTGDLNLDCKLDSEDSTIFEEYLQVVTAINDRNSLAECMDMDNDLDVDSDDLTCLTNVISSKWYGDVNGDFSNDACSAGSMKGGFCFDIDTDSEIPGDVVNDGKLDANDEQVIEGIIDAVSAGVTPSEDILGIADFNQDGTVNSADLDCLRKLFTVDFATGDVIMPETPIPESCMAIFGLECRGSKGDLNADGTISIIDLVILRFMVGGVLQTQPDMLGCADIDNNGQVNNYDLECMEAYFAGDQEYWFACLGCDRDLPENASSTIEICNDGWDNDCDGLRDDEDPLCACTSGTPCAMKWDSDGGTNIGISDGNFRTCANLGSGYDWHTASEINAECNTSSDWKSTYMCGGDIKYTCVFNYTRGFTYPATSSNGSFAWLAGEGNLGPIGVTTDCDDSGHPSCGTDWNSIGTSEGKECGTEYEKYSDGNVRRCSFCRFKYDFCQKISCSPSGEILLADVTEEYSVCAGQKGNFWAGLGNPAGLARCSSETQTYSGPAYGFCSDGWSNYNELCSTAGECMGLWGANTNNTNSSGGSF